MAQPDTRKEELIRALEQDRRDLQRHARGIRSEADLPARFHKSFTAHPAGWIGASALAGIVLGLLKPRGRGKSTSEPKPRTARFAPLGFLLRSAFEMGKPFLLEWATDKIQGFVQRESAGKPRWAAGQSRETSPPSARSPS
jgi:hypothetical protein